MLLDFSIKCYNFQETSALLSLQPMWSYCIVQSNSLVCEFSIEHTWMNVSFLLILLVTENLSEHRSKRQQLHHWGGIKKQCGRISSESCSPHWPPEVHPGTNLSVILDFEVHCAQKIGSVWLSHMSLTHAPVGRGIKTCDQLRFQSMNCNEREKIMWIKCSYKANVSLCFLTQTHVPAVQSCSWLSS